MYEMLPSIQYTQYEIFAFSLIIYYKRRVYLFCYYAAFNSCRDLLILRLHATPRYKCEPYNEINGIIMAIDQIEFRRVDFLSRLYSVNHFFIKIE